MIERAHVEEQQKMSNDMCRKTFIACLRDQNYMYEQTTKNPRNALYCRVSVSSQRNPCYATHSSLNYSQMHVLPSNCANDTLFDDGAITNRLSSAGADIRTQNAAGLDNDFFLSPNAINNIQRSRNNQANITDQAQLSHKNVERHFNTQNSMPNSIDNLAPKRLP